MLGAAMVMAAATVAEAKVNVETQVRKYFSAYPVLINIAKCESRMRHLDEKGRLLKNPKSSASGVMQIMLSYHKEPAARLGLDLATLDGNLRYALHLYKNEGTRPWNASRHCWG